VTWNEVIPTDGVAITGYKLYMDDGYSGNFFVVYDGSGYPFTTSYTAVNLTTGLPYRFYVVASNINGDSIGSNTAIIYSCLIPSGLNTPIKTGTTTSSIAISWNEPNPNGCPITGFAIYRDTGNNDPLTVQVDPTIVSNQPSLISYNITGLSPTSYTFRIKVRAFNADGYTDS
jgi:hypothetical protein